VEPHAFDLDLAALLDDGAPAVPAELSAHLEGCRRCRDLLAAHRRVAETLRGLERQRAPARLTLESVLQRLDPESEAAPATQLFRSARRLRAPQKLTPPAWRSLRPPRARTRVLQLTSALLAAAIAVGVGLALWPHHKAPVIRVSIVSMENDAEIAKLSKRDRDTLLVFAPATGLMGDAR
jgi:anti-sigma factor RsiW